MQDQMTKLNLDYKLINNLRQQGKTLKEIMTILELPITQTDYERFKKHLSRKAPKYLLDAGTFKGMTPYASSVLVDSQGDVKLAWIKQSAEAKLLSTLIDKIHEIPEIKLKPIEIYPRQKLLEIPLFDMHFGVANYEYYEPHLDEIRRYIHRLYEHIVITVGSDMLHHNDMRSQTASGTPIEQLNIRTAWNDALKFYIGLITEAVDHANEVTVIYVKGNHDESLSWSFVQLLKQLFPTVHFNDDFKERKVFLWEQIFIGYIHGDKPIKDIDKVFIKENKKAYGNAEITEIHIGHLHRENLKGNVQDTTGTMVRVLSTGNITDSWSDDNNYVGANKRFQLFEYGPKKLSGIYYVDGEE